MIGFIPTGLANVNESYLERQAELPRGSLQDPAVAQLCGFQPGLRALWQAHIPVPPNDHETTPTGASGGKRPGPTRGTGWYMTHTIAHRPLILNPTRPCGITSLKDKRTLRRGQGAVTP
jgi:hypothetical protein